jgi:acyl transferase domain-containing protein/acyl-CoA synthetase (AMP-forming)/AMP-acid ligase II/acyl carrier protein
MSGQPDLVTLVELLRRRAREHPEREACKFLADGHDERDTLRYGELDRRARAIAARLQAEGLAGERALLLYPAGLEYVSAFLGCLYAGVVAVPAYPPVPNRPLGRLRAIAADAAPAVVLAAPAVAEQARDALTQAAGRPGPGWLDAATVDPAEAAAWQAPPVDGDSLAFLQYTSGSTGAPKGVMVSHANILANQRMIAAALRSDQASTIVTWLPIFHDMGLIGNVLHALYTGALVVVMSSEAFLKRPLRWLQAISRYRARVSGGPNFAYELALRKIAPEERDRLDLRAWEVAFNGAEPVRADTLARFGEYFAPCGLRPDALWPCYGLAETTLLVSSRVAGERPLVSGFTTAGLQAGRAVPASTAGPDRRTLVGCGRAWLDGRLLIVDPERRTVRPQGQVGEVWVAGPHVARGYWRRPEETEKTFGARLADGQGPFLRTGDLGFLHHGELFLTGRSKDLIIILGRNHYPQDLELSAERSHPALRPGCGAAFGVEVGAEERVVIVQEVDRRADREQLDDATAAIRQALSDEHDLAVHAVLLVRPGSVPKTSSGKVERHSCRAMFLAGQFQVVHEWRGPVEAPTAPAADGSRGAAEIESWLLQRLAGHLGLPPGAIDPTTPLGRYGLSSRDAVGLAGDLEEWLGRQLPPTLLYEHPTVRALARHLGGERPGPVAAPARRRVTGEPVAVVGVGCRFPGDGGGGPEAFWQILRDGVDAITEVPADRWDAEAWYEPDPQAPGKMSTRWGGFLPRVDAFDAAFFGIAPREAEEMDPQQRLVLEVAWEALEHAGQAPDRLTGSSAGVFLGISSNDYARLQEDPERIGPYWATGNALSIAANRVSYLLGLRGPSVAVDTACSSSLVAVHLAVQSLRSGECDLALAGGVNLILAPEPTITFSKAGMMAADGRCKVFDAAADGFVRGEGCGVVVLKRLADAQAAGDNVLAVVRGSAVNQDGATMGLTAPNPDAQLEVVRAALADGGVPPWQVTYVEAHGTGTRLGDPIEVRALTEALGEDRPGPLLVGSVKTNVGHLEAAAGVAGLIKVILALRHGEIPPHLHLRNLNPALPADRVTVPAGRLPWPPGRRVAGVSSFSFGGTNAHVVVEEPPPRPAPPAAPQRPLHLLRLAARGEQELRELVARHRDELARPGAPPLADTCYTLSTGRARAPWRLAVRSGSSAEASQALSDWLAGASPPAVASGRVEDGRPPRVAFLLTGQGAQHPGMGRRLYETQPTFRQTLERCGELLRPHLDRPLLSVLYPPAGTRSPIDQTRYTQPALFAVEYALAQLWRSWGVEPAALLGHSVGELVAACLAGVFSLEDGLGLVAERARLMQSLPEDGAMAAVFAPEVQVLRAIGVHRDRVGVAAVNAPGQVVVSGERQALGKVLDTLSAAGVRTRRLRVSHAFHSPLMTPVEAPFERRVRAVHSQAPRLPLVSGLTGQVAAGDLAEPAYWRRQLREPVRFAAAMRTLRRLGCDTFLEVGPAPVLVGLGRQCLPEEAVRWLASLSPGDDDWHQLLAATATLDLAGAPIDWAGFDRGYPRRKVPLPTYPWRRKRYWTPAVRPAGKAPARQRGAHPMLGDQLAGLASQPHSHAWERGLDSDTLPYLDDHRIGGSAVAPLSLFLELALAAGGEVLGRTPLDLHELRLHQPLFLYPGSRRTLQVCVTAEAREAAFAAYSRPLISDGGAWTLHASARLRPSAPPPSDQG